jgi:hypothetical protein
MELTQETDLSNDKTENDNGIDVRGRKGVQLW